MALPPLTRARSDVFAFVDGHAARWLMTALLASALGCGLMAAAVIVGGNGDGRPLLAVLGMLASTTAAIVLWAVLQHRAVRLLEGARREFEDERSARRQIEEALDELPIGLEIYDPDDRLLYYNRHVAKLYPWIDFGRHLGNRFEDILRESIRQGRIPAARGQEEDWLRERLAQRGTREGPLLQNLKSGPWIKTFERRTHGGGVVGARIEVTDLVERSRELEASRERLQAVIGSASVAILSVDAAGRILEGNAAATRLFGVDRPLVGSSLADLVPGFVASASPRPQDVQGRAPDGSALQLELSAAEIGTGSDRQFVVVITDLTPRQQAEQARRLLEDQLREAQRMESIGTLAAGIAHDFNNVLGAMLGHLALAQQDLQAGELSRSAQAIGHAGSVAQRARDLVQQILTFSRRRAVERTVQDLRPIVLDALKILRATLPANVRLETQMPDVELPVHVNAVQIEQVLLNLCTNAWQAMEGRGGQIRVGGGLRDVATSAATPLSVGPGPFVCLWVEDDGVGMDDRTRARLFEPFFTTKPIGEGTGLGLSVVHGIVKSHEGAIAVASEHGKGARFDVFLPMADPALARPSVVGGDPIGAAGAGERVLYVDDDDVMPVMVERLLERAGYGVRCFAGAQEAVNAVRDDPAAFDVVVTDYDMPGLSGADVVRAVGVLRPDLPVVVTSGLVTDELRALLLASGAVAVVEKQNTLEQLPAAVARALAWRRSSGGTVRPAA